MHRRQWSTLKNAHRGIMITIILSIILYSPIFYCYQANLINAPLKCYGKSDLCRLTNALSYACLTIIFPIVFMFIFGLLTIINIHQSKSRIHAINSVIELNPIGNISKIRGLSNKKIDRRLFFMLLIQILLLSLFTLPQAIQKLYSTLTAAINNFIFNLVLLLTYFANGMSFYIYTLSGGIIFRKALKDFIRNIKSKFLLVDIVSP